MKKLTICTISALIMLTAGTAFAAKAEQQPSSRDIQLKNGEWTALAQIYPVPSVSSDVSQALTPERLASWWNVFNDPMMTELVLASLKGNRDLASARPASCPGWIPQISGATGARRYRREAPATARTSTSSA